MLVFLLSLGLGWRAVMFQLSGFYCSVGVSKTWWPQPYTRLFSGIHF